MVSIEFLFKEYKQKFHGRKCMVHTTYHDINEIVIEFSILDFPHLIGLHKITKLSATKLVELAERDKLGELLEDRSLQDKEVYRRMKQFYFLSDVFYEQKETRCIVEKDIVPNTMKLSLIFRNEGKRHVAVLGLKKDKKGVFHPATLHEANSKKYKGYRHTLVKSIKWI